MQEFPFKEMAQLNYFQGGSAIYNAAGALGLEINPSIPLARYANPETSLSLPKTDLLLIPSLNIFPNPTTGKVWLVVNRELQRIEVMNSSGKTVYLQSGKKVQLDLDLTPGMYFIRVIDYDNTMYLKKLMIIRP